MIKRTLYFGNPAYLKTNNEQLVIEMHSPENTGQAPEKPWPPPLRIIGLFNS